MSGDISSVSGVIVLLTDRQTNTQTVLKTIPPATLAVRVVITDVGVVSGVPRILEWEGSRSYRLRGAGVRGGGIPSPLREGYGEGLSPENFSYFLLLKIPHFDAF